MASLLLRLFLAALLLGGIFLPQRASAADGTPPVSIAVLTGNFGSNDWYTSTVAVNIRSEDLESGIKSITYRIDSNQPVTDNFTTSENLLANPSFELGSIDGWTVSGGATFSQDGSTARFDTNSAKIVSSTAGFKYWQPISGIALTAGKTYTFSAWVRYSGVIGVGVKLVLDNVATTPLTGSGNWARVYLNYQPLTSGSFTPQLGVDGPGTVNFDGAALYEAAFPAESGFVVSTAGNHTVTYQATNNDNVTESQKNVSFKIDAAGPSGWRNLISTESGNDHTFTFSIDVDDPISGLDTPAGQYQYSLDGGATWGRYSDLERCNSTWIPDGWVPTTQTPSTPGSSTTTMRTPRTDFCDSNFAGCSKKIRFQIRDLAGNTSSKDNCINSAWFQGQGGGLHSVGDVAPAAASTVDFLASSNGSITNLTSGKGWVFPGYSLAWTVGSVYTSWRDQHYQGAAALPGGQLPSSGAGFYKVTSSYTVDRNTLPTNIATADVNAVVFIDGNLSMDEDFSMKAASAYVFVVSGDVLVDGNVQNIAGYYLAQGKFDDHNGGPSNKQLVLTGAVWANGELRLERDLGKPANTGTPAEKFILPAGTFLNSELKGLLAGEVGLFWQEVNSIDEGCP